MAPGLDSRNFFIVKSRFCFTKVLDLASYFVRKLRAERVAGVLEMVLMKILEQWRMMLEESRMVDEGRVERRMETEEADLD